VFQNITHCHINIHCLFKVLSKGKFEYLDIIVLCNNPEILGLVIDNILQWQTIRITINFWSRLWLDNG
jgi:hypothetical protein